LKSLNFNLKPPTNLLLNSPCYAEACNEFAVPSEPGP